MFALKKLFIFISLALFMGSAQVFAASVDHFEVVITPDKAKVDEALDIEIRAVDSNNQIVTDYNGTIIVFSETDKYAEFPNDLEENTYTFTPQNGGEVKFENAVKFKTAGDQSISVYDLDDDSILGTDQVTISGGASVSSQEINILSPENGIQIGDNNVTISGMTARNHRVIIEVNGGEEISTTSNGEGIYEKNITNLQNGENSLMAYVLDADNNRVGQSQTVQIRVNSSNPVLNAIKTSPAGELDSESEVEVEIAATPGLTEVSVVLNDIVTKLKETQSGKYTVTLIGPKNAGDYPVGVILKDEFGHEISVQNATTISIKESILSSAPGDSGTGETVITTQTTAPTDQDPMKISGIKLTVLKTKSILTWDENENAQGYNIYKKLGDEKYELITNVEKPYFEVNITGDKITYDYFAIKAVGKTGSGLLYEGDLSEATKIQTGPELLLILIIISLLGAGIYMYRKEQTI